MIVDGEETGEEGTGGEGEGKDRRWNALFAFSHPKFTIQNSAFESLGAELDEKLRVVQWPAAGQDDGNGFEIVDDDGSSLSGNGVLGPVGEVPA